MTSLYSSMAESNLKEHIKTAVDRYIDQQARAEIARLEREARALLARGIPIHEIRILYHAYAPEIPPLVVALSELPSSVRDAITRLPTTPTED